LQLHNWQTNKEISRECRWCGKREIFDGYDSGAMGSQIAEWKKEEIVNLERDLGDPARSKTETRPRELAKTT